MLLRLTPIALALSLLLLPPAAARADTPAAAPAASAMQTSFSPGTPVAADATLTLDFAGAFAYGPGRFVVMVGGEDVTAQFELTSPGQLRGVFAGAPLPAGETVLAVHGLDEGNAWRLVAQAPLLVAALPGGGPRAVITPTVALTLSARPWEDHSSTANPPAAHQDLSATVDAGLSTDHGDATWGLKTALKISAVSDHADALQYAALGNAARRVDLASYLVDGQVQTSLGTSRLALGHVEAGDHPLLAQAIAHRGLLATQALGPRTALMVSMQSASPVLGWANPSGLTDRDNRFTLASVSHELLQRPGALRAELSGFDGDTGPVITLGSSPPSGRRQHSQGWGLRLRAETEDQAWRGELALARSQFTDLGARPVDPGDPGSAPVSGTAFTLELGHTLVKARPLWNDWPFSLTATARLERSAPQYQSLGAFGVIADQRKHHLGLDATLGEFSGGLTVDSVQTNLDGDLMQPRRHTPAWGLHLAAPLGAWLAPKDPHSPWPVLDFRFQRSHTWLDQRYAQDPITSAFEDAVTSTHSLSLGWTWPTGSVNYTLSRVFDDNRLTPHDDTLNLDHGVSATWQLSETAKLNLDLGWNPSRHWFDGSRKHAKSADLSGSWRFGQRTTLSARLGYQLDRDTPINPLYPAHEWRRVITGGLTLSQTFEVPLLGKMLPAQWTLSYQHQRTDLRDGSMSSLLRVRYDQLDLGLSISY